MHSDLIHNYVSILDKKRMTICTSLYYSIFLKLVKYFCNVICNFGQKCSITFDVVNVPLFYHSISITLSSCHYTGRTEMAYLFSGISWKLFARHFSSIPPDSRMLEPVMTLAATTLIPTRGTPTIGLTAMELDVPGRYQGPEITESAVWAWPTTQW